MNVEIVPLPPVGIGDSRAHRSTLGRLLDCDGAMVHGDPRNPDSWAFGAMPGVKRIGPKIRRSSVHGTPSSTTTRRLQIFRLSPTNVLRPGGHGLAVADAATGFTGRVLAIGTMEAGRHGDTLFSAAKRTDTWADLDTTIAVTGTYTGTDGCVKQVVVESGATTFKHRTKIGTGAWSAYTTGVAIATTATSIGDGCSIAWESTSGHAENDAYSITAGPGAGGHLAWEFDRVSVADKPWIVNARGAAMVGNQWNMPIRDNGDSVGIAAIPPPRFPPVVYTTNSGSAAMSDAFDSGTPPTGWAAGGSVTISAETTIKVAGAQSLKAVIPSTHADGTQVATRTGTWTVKNSANRMRIYLRHNGAANKFIPSSAIYFQMTIDGQTHQVNLPANYRLNGGRWHFIDCYHDPSDSKLTSPSSGSSYTASDFKIFVKASAIPADMFSSGNISFYFDSLEYVNFENVHKSALFDTQGQYFFKAAQTRDGVPSSGGPVSQPIVLKGHRPTIDYAGDFPSSNAWERNALHAEATGAMFYANMENWPFGSRFQGEPEFIAVVDNAEIARTSLTTSGNKITYAIGDATINGRFVSEFRPRERFYNDPFPAVLSCIADGDVLVGGGQPVYRVGTFTFTNGSQLVTRVSSGSRDTTPIVSDAFVGRRIVADGDDEIYWIIAAVDTDADGVLDSYVVGRTPDLDRHVGGYEGTTGDKSYRIEGEDRGIWWSNVSNKDGPDPLHCSLEFSYREVLPEGDSVQAVVPVGEFIYIFGNFNYAVASPRRDSRVDLIGLTPGRFDNVQLIRGTGIAGPEAWAVLADNSLVICGARGEFFRVNTSSVERLPASVDLAGLMSGAGGLLAPNDLSRVWLAAHRAQDREIVWAALPSSYDDPATQTGRGLEPGLANKAQSVHNKSISSEVYIYPPTDTSLAGPPTQPESATWGPAFTSGSGGSLVRTPLAMPEYPMHEIPGLIGGAWHFEGSPSLWTQPDNASGWEDSTNVAGFWPIAADVSTAYAWFLVGDVTGLTAPGVSGNTHYSGPTSSRNLPSAVPTPYTDLSSHWDSRTPVMVKNTALTTVLEAAVPGALPNNYNAVNKISGWKAAECQPTASDSYGYHPGLQIRGFRFETEASWADTPTTPQEIAFSRAYRNGSSPASGFTVDSGSARMIDGAATGIRFRAWLEGLASKTLAAGTLEIVFRNLEDLPDDSSQPANSSDRAIDLPALGTNAWTSVSIAAPAPNGTYTDRSGTIRPCCWYTHILIRRKLPLVHSGGGSIFNATNNDLHLFFGCGHWRAVPFEDMTDDEIDDLDEEVLESIVPFEVDAEEAESTNPYRFGVAIDTGNGMAFAKTDYRFSCASRQSKPGRGVADILGGGLLLGGEDGYISLMADEFTSWGSPSGAHVFLVDSQSPGSSTTIVPDLSAFPVSPITVDDDSGSTLDGLIVAKISKVVGKYKSVEYRRIASNTASTITVAVAWATNPVAGDIVVVAPLAWFVHWPEIRHYFPATPLSLALDVEARRGEATANVEFPPIFTFFNYGASGDAIEANPANVSVRQSFNLDELQAYAEMPLVRLARKAFSPGLEVLAGQEGKVTARAILTLGTRGGRR